MSQFKRALWHINRTPAREVVKVFRRLKHRDSVASREALARDVVPTNDTREAVAWLNTSGYADLTDLMEETELAALASASEAKLANAKNREVSEVNSSKFFWTRLLDEDLVDGQFSANSPFVKFALQPPIISFVTEVFGTIPRLDYVTLTYSSASDRPLASSQLWHRDHDDTRVLKIFVYLTDVDSEDDGPFSFFTAPHSDKVGFSLKSHRPDAALPIGVSDSTKMLGKKLTTFAVETSRCLHMGSRVARGHHRLMYTATFFAHPRIFPEPPSLFRLSGDEDAIQAKILSADA